MQTAESHRCAVMVDISEYQNTLNLMADVITGKALQKGFAADRDSVLVLLQQCIDHYLAYILGPNVQENLGFGYYITTVFSQYQTALQEDMVVKYLSDNFAVVVGQVAQKLRAGLMELEFKGQRLQHLYPYTVQPGRLMLYTLEGQQW